MDRPAFRDLPAGPGETRWVGGTLMTEEQYRIEGWHRVLAYEGAKGPVDLWEAELDGLREWSRIQHQRREQRREAYRRRDQEEDAFREYVDTLQDAKAPYRSGKEGDK